MTPLQLTMADNGKRVELTMNTHLLVALDENPITGYCWTIDSIQPLAIMLVNEEYTNNPNVGYGGIRQFTFHTVQSGAVRLSFKLTHGSNQSIAGRYTVFLRRH